MRDIRFWRRESGRSPIEEDIEAIALTDPIAFKKIKDQINLLATYGLGAVKYGGSMEKVKGYRYKGLIEVKAKNRSIQYRLLCVLEETICWVLNFFIKKTKKLRIKEIELAINRTNSLGLH